MADEPRKTRMTIADIWSRISVRGLTFGSILAFICHYILTEIGWNNENSFGGAFDNLNPETAKILITALAAIIGVSLDKLPEVKDWLIRLLSQSDVMPRQEIKERLDVIETKVDAIKEVTDNLDTVDT